MTNHPPDNCTSDTDKHPIGLGQPHFCQRVQTTKEASSTYLLSPTFHNHIFQTNHVYLNHLGAKLSIHEAVQKCAGRDRPAAGRQDVSSSELLTFLTAFQDGKTSATIKEGGLVLLSQSAFVHHNHNIQVKKTNKNT